MSRLRKDDTVMEYRMWAALDCLNDRIYVLVWSVLSLTSPGPSPHRGACIKHLMSLIHSQCQLYSILLSIKQHGDGALHSGYSGPRWKCGEYLSANFCFMGKFSFHNHDLGVGAVCHRQEAFPLASFQIPAGCRWSLNNHLFHSSLTLPA
jgi:hypothetical protein